MTVPIQLSGPVTLEIPADAAALFLVRGLVERFTARLGFAREEIDRMVLAVDEACTNIIRHAYHQEPGKRIMLTMEADEIRLELRIRDFGAPVPEDVHCLNCRDLNDVRPGGLGLHFIRSAMDEVCFEKPAEGGNVLRLIKRRRPVL